MLGSCIQVTLAKRLLYLACTIVGDPEIDRSVGLVIKGGGKIGT